MDLPRRSVPPPTSTADTVRHAIPGLPRILYRHRSLMAVWMVAHQVFSHRTLRLMMLDLMRWGARLRHPIGRRVRPASRKLHLGCGARRVPGWLNVDLVKSDYDVDLAAGLLPWPTGAFDVVVSQQVIEHLDLAQELLPLFRELRRVLRPGGQLWLSSPDMEKACRSYLEHRMRDLLGDHLARYPEEEDLLGRTPPQHFLNHLFHQGGDHQNLFDLELLGWALEGTGFVNITGGHEGELLDQFPEFPPRDDDAHSLYVRARVPLPDPDP